MNKLAIVLILTILFIAAAGLIFFWNLPDSGPTYITKAITFGRSEPKLYFKLKNWGITADHQTIELSVDSQSKPDVDSLRNYIYKGLDFIFYKTSYDSLFLYVYSKSPTPTHFHSKFKVLQIQVENRDMMTLFENDNYKKKGLNIFR